MLKKQVSVMAAAAAPSVSTSSSLTSDTYAYSESAVAGTFIFNVAANDKAKGLYALDDGQPSDLLTQDFGRSESASNDRSALGAKIWITADGQVGYSTAGIAALVDALGVGERLVDSFIYAVKSGSNVVYATARITFTGTNDRPVAVVDTALGREDQIASGSVADNDYDVDHGAVLSFAASNPPPGFAMASNGSWMLDATHPAYQSLGAGQTSVLTVAYSVTDQHGLSATSTLTITVSGSNDAPIVLSATTGDTAGEDGGTTSGIITFREFDAGDAHSASVVAKPGAAGLGTLVVDGIGPASAQGDKVLGYTYTVTNPAANALAAGEVAYDSFIVTISDANGGSVARTVVVTVVGTNDAPVAIAATASGNEDMLLGGTVGATDVDHGAVLTFAASAAPAGFAMASDGSWTLDASHAVYQNLGAGETLTLSIPFVATDQQGASSTSTLTVTVVGTNDAPVVTAATASGTEDAPLSGTVMGNDVDGTVLTFAASVEAAGFAMASDGSWTLDASHAAYQHLAAGQSLTLSIPFTATDDQGASSTSVLTLTITGSNDAPVATVAAASASEGAGKLGGSLVGSVSDADDGAALSFAASDLPAGLTIDANGDWRFDASHAAYDSLNAGEIRNLVVAYQVTDENGASSSATLTVTVTGTNDAPVAVGQAVSGMMQPYGTPTLFSGSVAGLDADAGDTLSYALTGFVPDGFVMNSDGSWTFAPSRIEWVQLAAGEATTGQLTYTVTDQHGASSTGILELTVVGTNDLPFADPATAAATEDSVVSGTFAATDIDHGAVVTYAVHPQGTAAGFSIASDGRWSFDASNPAYQSLAAGQTAQVVVGIVSTDQFGATTLAPLTFTVTGTNDAAVRTGPAAVLANGTEDVAYTVTTAQCSRDGATSMAVRSASAD